VESESVSDINKINLVIKIIVKFEFDCCLGNTLPFINTYGGGGGGGGGLY